MQRVDPQETVKVPATLAAPGAGPFWLAVILTGIAAGGGTVLLTLLLKAVQAIVWPAPPETMLLAAAAAATPWHHVAVLAAAGLVTAIGQVALVRLSSGNSIDITAAIWFAAGRLPALRTLASAVLSIIIVGMGAALGREGAPKQAGAVFANLFSSAGRLTDEQRRLLVACGAGAGMAAAYGVPLGGALFALEVLRGVLSLRLVLPALLTSLLATGTAWLVLPNAPTYAIPAYEGSVSTLLWALVAGPVIGIVSVGIVRAIAWADRNKPRGWLRVALPVAAFTGLGLVAVPFPQLLGNGQDVSQLAFAGEIAAPLMLVLLVLRPLATFACFGSGAPGGLFTPSLALGALLGGVLGHAWLLVWPGTPPGLFALLGAAALLAATTQGPISALVLMMELTGRDRSFIAPLLLIVIVATMVSRTIERRSIYEARLSDDQVGKRLAAREHKPASSKA